MFVAGNSSKQKCVPKQLLCRLVWKIPLTMLHHFLMFAGSAIKGQILSAAATISIGFKIFILVYSVFYSNLKEILMAHERHSNTEAIRDSP